MGVYSRFKRSPDGFRKLVELLETTPIAQREKMIKVGMSEDEEFTRRALACVMTFEDVLGLPDAELAELVSRAKPKILAYSLHAMPTEVQERFLKLAPLPVATAVRDHLTEPAQRRDIGGAQLSLIGLARKLEHAGLIKAKRIG